MVKEPRELVFPRPQLQLIRCGFTALGGGEGNLPHFLNVFIFALFGGMCVFGVDFFCFLLCRLKAGVNTSRNTETVNTVFKQISEKMGLLLTGVEQARGWYQSLPVYFVCVNSFLIGISIKIGLQ